MRRSRRRALEFESRWGDLATYNAEVARGIVHTPEWQLKMAEKQQRYNRWQFEMAGYGAQFDGGGGADC